MVTTLSPQEDWVCMGVPSDGSYNITKGLMYSFPVRIKPDCSWEIVQGLPVSDFGREKMKLTEKELIEEKDLALSFLGK